MHALDKSWEALKQDYEAACARSARTARSQITDELNQSFRRLRQYQTEGEWVSAVLDAAARFVQQIAVFSLNNGVAVLRGKYNLNLPEKLSFPMASAAAFAGAIQAKDPVVAMRRPSEVTEALSAADSNERAHIFPITNGARVVALLFAADQEYMDVNALELIAGMASAVLERHSNVSLHAQIAPPLSGGETSSNGRLSKMTLPAWADLDEDQRSLHIRAQRFSRVAVADMQLAHPEACRAGRERGDLYLLLKKEIDAARESYRRHFLTIPSMVDYFHLELVRTAAEGDELKLGAEYPGQLV